MVLPPPINPPVRNLSPAAKTALGFQNTSYQSRMVQVNNLNVRTRDLRSNAFAGNSAGAGSSGSSANQTGISSIALNGWANSFGQSGHFQSYGGSRYDQNVYGISLGIDKQFREKDAVWYLGVRGQYSKADQKLDGDVAVGTAIRKVWLCMVSGPINRDGMPMPFLLPTIITRISRPASPMERMHKQATGCGAMVPMWKSESIYLWSGIFFWNLSYLLIIIGSMEVPLLMTTALKSLPMQRIIFQQEPV